MFQLAWISPGQQDQREAHGRHRTRSRAADGGGGHQVFQQRSETLPDTAYGSSSGFSEYFSSDRVIELGDVHLPHAPAAEAPLEISS
jgi:hypothetical protein